MVKDGVKSRKRLQIDINSPRRELGKMRNLTNQLDSSRDYFGRYSHQTIIWRQNTILEVKIDKHIGPSKLRMGNHSVAKTRFTGVNIIRLEQDCVHSQLKSVHRQPQAVEESVHTMLRSKVKNIISSRGFDPGLMN